MPETSPDELLTRLGVYTDLYAFDEEVIFAALNDRDRGYFFAVDRRGGGFRWRVENAPGWVIAPPLIWGGLFIVGTSAADMSRREEEGHFATVSWRRGGAVYAFEAERGTLRYRDGRTGVVRVTPRVEGSVLIVEGEVRVGGFREGAPWSASAEVESRFDAARGGLMGRRVRGKVPSGYFRGEPAPAPWA